MATLHPPEGYSLRLPPRVWGLVLAVCLTSPAGADPPLLRQVHDCGLPETGKTYGATWLDVDGDGRLDLFLSRHSRRPEIYRSRGDLRFERIDPKSCPVHEFRDQHGAAACDYDDDGDWDLYVTVGANAGKGEGPNQLWTQLSPCTFARTPADHLAADVRGRGRGAVWLELNGDARPELLVLNYRSPSRLFQARGETWEDLTAWLPVDPRTGSPAGYTSAQSGDLDRDGDVDLILGGPPHAVLINDTGQALHPIPPSQSGLSFSHRTMARPALGDLDGDGNEDLVIGYRAPAMLEVWLNASDGGEVRFLAGPDLATLPLADQMVSLALADLDNDGRLDVYVSQLEVPDSKILAHAPDLIALGTGDGGFAPAVGPIRETPTHERSSKGLSTCAWPIDLDRDGDLDVVALRGGGPDSEAKGAVVVYENTSTRRGLTIELVSAQGPPHGLGARVELPSSKSRGVQSQNGLPRIARTVRSDANPWNSAILPLHFGVGDARGPFSIRVSWPSGREQEVELPRAGQAYRVTEGEKEATVLR